MHRVFVFIFTAVCASLSLNFFFYPPDVSISSVEFLASPPARGIRIENRFETHDLRGKQREVSRGGGSIDAGGEGASAVEAAPGNFEPRRVATLLLPGYPGADVLREMAFAEQKGVRFAKSVTVRKPAKKSVNIPKVAKLPTRGLDEISQENTALRLEQDRLNRKVDDLERQHQADFQKNVEIESSIALVRAQNDRLVAQANQQSEKSDSQQRQLNFQASVINIGAVVIPLIGLIATIFAAVASWLGGLATYRMYREKEPTGPIQVLDTQKNRDYET